MKKYIVAIVILALVLFGGAVILQKRPSTPRVSRSIQQPVGVNVVIDTGTDISTTSAVTAQTVFDALSAAANARSLELKTKQYDFGVFVEQIGTLANTKEKSWIYFVNGKSGTVAADKQNLNAGDTVEWKYITPTIE